MPCIQTPIQAMHCDARGEVSRLWELKLAWDLTAAGGGMNCQSLLGKEEGREHSRHEGTLWKVLLEVFCLHVCLFWSLTRKLF